MSYCSKIYIVDKTGQPNWNINKYYAKILCVFNLDNVTLEFEDWLHKQKPTDHYVYMDDGDTPILEDCYGEPLREINLRLLRDELQNEIERRGPRYINNNLLHALAEGVIPMFMDKYYENCDQYVALHYGY